MREGCVSEKMEPKSEKDDRKEIGRRIRARRIRSNKISKKIQERKEKEEE
jgi:hypothetical protein